MRDDLDRTIVRIIMIIMLSVGFILVGLSGYFDYNDCIEKYGKYQCEEMDK